MVQLGNWTARRPAPPDGWVNLASPEFKANPFPPCWWEESAGDPDVEHPDLWAAKLLFAPRTVSGRRWRPAPGGGCGGRRIRPPRP
jgi:hypothetical protein